MDTDNPTSEAVPTAMHKLTSNDVTTSDVPMSEGIPSSDWGIVAPFAGFTKENMCDNETAPSSEVPKTNRKKRGRPRKSAAEGEDKRRIQMKGKRQKEIKVTPDTSKQSKVTPVTSANTYFERSSSSGRLPSKLVNSTVMYLPDGWQCFAIKRSAGRNKGLHDVAYVTPGGDRLRSRRDIYKWTKANNSDLDPCKFLFTRSTEVLFREENFNQIIFREAAARGQSKIYIHDYVPGRPKMKYKAKKQFYTVISDAGKELLLDDGSSSASPLNMNESKEGTPKKKESAKRRRVPLKKTLDCLKSPYFSLENQIPVQPVSIHAIHNPKWIPPRSPYNLIQEDLFHNPWQLLIATIFLNCTSGKLAIPVLHEFLTRWPSPHEACSASILDIADVIQLLGLARSRAATITRFSHEFLTVNWKKPSELFGIGKYGCDSYKVFCLGQWKSVESEDRYLNLYVNWLHNTCGKHGHGSRRSTGSTALTPM